MYQQIESYRPFFKLKYSYGHPLSLMETSVCCTQRDEFVRKYSWSIPTHEAVKEVSQFIDDPVLSVGAGRGLWEYLLSLETSYPIKAIDKKVPDKTYYPVEEISIQNFHEKYPILFTSWAPYCEGMASVAVLRQKPKRIIYIGEEPGGCVAEDHFFVLSEVYYKVTKEIFIPCWVGIHDRIVIFDRNDTPFTEEYEETNEHDKHDEHNKQEGPSTEDYEVIDVM